MENISMPESPAQNAFLLAIEKKRKENPELTYQEALRLAGHENPELYQRARKAVLSERG